MKMLNLLIKPASSSCNMRCTYCFYQDVAESRAEPRRGMMSVDTLERIVQSALSEAEVACTFGFQGGEPTLVGLDFYRQLIAFEQKYNVHRVRIVNTLQTNGLVIDEEWARFLSKHQFLTGLSIDGPKEAHDLLRMDAQGKGTHNRCLRAAQLLTRTGAEFNILSVVTRALASHPDRAYAFYKKQGFHYLQFIPCMDELSPSPGSHPHSLDASMYGRFLCRMFDLWYADVVKGEQVSIRTFDNYLAMLMGYPPENCAMSGRCTAQLVIEGDGDVYPCDFYALDEYRMGNILTSSIPELFDSEAVHRFIGPSEAVHPRCSSCSYYPLCRGGCRRDHVLAEGDDAPLTRYCESYRMFFDHALPRLQSLARQALERRYVH